MSRKRRTVNPRQIEWTIRAIQAHPGWNVQDISTFTYCLALAEGHSRGVSPSTIERLITENKEVFDLAVNGQIALTEGHKRRPAWLLRMPKPTVIPYAPKGQAFKALHDQIIAKAEQIADDEARKEYLDQALGGLNGMIATPTQRMRIYAENEEACFNTHHRLSDIKTSVVERDRKIEQLMAQMETNNRLVLEFLNRHPPVIDDEAAAGFNPERKRPGARPSAH
jgi:hypothetical protein